MHDMVKRIGLMSVCLFLFCIGLVFPLTPSVGVPNLWSVLVFYVLPILGCVYGISFSSKKGYKIVFVMELALIAVAGGAVLVHIYGK
jgi:hypothetical protein